jgi:hypothetical protein
MCNCSSNFSNFDGLMDNEFDSFIRTKAGKKRRARKKALRDEGMSRKEARKQALKEIPRTKKKRQAVKLANAEKKAQADAISVQEVLEVGAPEMLEMMEEGILSSDPNIASLEVAESIGEDNPMMRMQEAVATQTSMAMSPVMSMTEAIEGVEDETDGKILGLPRNVVLIGAVAVAGLVLLPRLMR